MSLSVLDAGSRVRFRADGPCGRKYIPVSEMAMVVVPPKTANLRFALLKCNAFSTRSGGTDENTEWRTSGNLGPLLRTR
jgi:hypothetical protein